MDDLSKKERDFTGVLNETEKWDLIPMSYVARKVWSARWHNLIAFFAKCNEG